METDGRGARMHRRQRSVGRSSVAFVSNLLRAFNSTESQNDAKIWKAALARQRRHSTASQVWLGKESERERLGVCVLACVCMCE